MNKTFLNFTTATQQGGPNLTSSILKAKFTCECQLFWSNIFYVWAECTQIDKDF